MGPYSDIDLLGHLSDLYGVILGGQTGVASRTGNKHPAVCTDAIQSAHNAHSGVRDTGSPPTDGPVGGSRRTMEGQNEKEREAP